VGGGVAQVSIAKLIDKCTLLHRDPKRQSARHADGEADQRQPAPDQEAQADDGQEHPRTTRVADHPVGPSSDHRLIKPVAATAPSCLRGVSA
jgi:hypothetical protein